MPGSVNYAGWTFTWSIPNNWGGGLMISNVEPEQLGTSVAGGTELGRIVDPYTFEVLEVVNAPFNEPVREKVPEVPLWKQPDNIQMAKDAGRYLVFAGVIAFLFFGVLRPMWRQASAMQPRMEMLPQSAGQSASSSTSTPAPPPPNTDALDRARKIAREDPKIVATVVKTWVTKDE